MGWLIKQVLIFCILRGSLNWYKYLEIDNSQLISGCREQKLEFALVRWHRQYTHKTLCGDLFRHTVGLYYRHRVCLTTRMIVAR